MSKVILDYPHLENAQLLYDFIVNHYEKFDWSGFDSDWSRNFKALQEILNHDENLYGLSIRLWTVETEDGEKVKTAFVYDPRINTYVDLNPSEGIENQFDFESPLDVLAVLDDLEARAQEFKSFYQIKPA